MDSEGPIRPVVVASEIEPGRIRDNGQPLQAPARHVGDDDHVLAEVELGLVEEPCRGVDWPNVP